MVMGARRKDTGGWIADLQQFMGAGAYQIDVQLGEPPVVFKIIRHVKRVEVWFSYKRSFQPDIV